MRLVRNLMAGSAKPFPAFVMLSRKGPHPRAKTLKQGVLALNLPVPGSTQRIAGATVRMQK